MRVDLYFVEYSKHQKQFHVGELGAIICANLDSMAHDGISDWQIISPAFENKEGAFFFLEQLMEETPESTVIFKVNPVVRAQYELNKGERMFNSRWVGK